MRVNWKKKALSLLSLVLTISMVFTSGLSTLGVEAASRIERTPKEVAVDKTAPESIPSQGDSLAGLKLFKGLELFKTPKFLSLESSHKSSLVNKEPAEKGAAPKTLVTETDKEEKITPSGETKAETKVDATVVDKEDAKSSAEVKGNSTKAVGEAESKVEQPSEKTTEKKEEPKADKEAPKEEEKPLEEEGKKEEAKEEKTTEDKKEEAPKAGPVDAAQGEITIAPSLDASIDVETVAAEGESSDPIASGDKVDKGTKIKVTVTPKKAGDLLRLHVGEEYKDIHVPGGSNQAGELDSSADTKAGDKAKEDKDQVDSGGTPVKKVDETEEKVGPTLTRVSAEADKQETPKATVKLGDSGGDLAPVSFEFTINKDTTIEIVKITAAGAPVSVSSTSEIYTFLTAPVPTYSFILASSFSNDATTGSTYSWANIVTASTGKKLTLSTGTGGVKFIGDGPEISTVTFPNITLENFVLADTLIPVLSVSGVSTITNSTVGDVAATGTTTITNSTVGDVAATGTTTITNSTVGDVAATGTTTITNSTVGDVAATGTTTISNSTVGDVALTGASSHLTIADGISASVGLSTVGHITSAANNTTVAVGKFAKVGNISVTGTTPTITIKNDATVGVITQHALMSPDNFTVGENVTIASLQAPYPVSIGKGSKIKFKDDKITANLTTTGTVYLSPVTVGGTLTVIGGVTLNVETVNVSDGADPQNFADITFANTSILGVQGTENTTPKNIVINAGDKTIRVGTPGAGTVTLNNWADKTSTAVPPGPPKSVMGTVNFKTSSGAIYISAQLVRGKNGAVGATVSDGTILAESEDGNITVGASGDPAVAGSLDYLNINIGTGKVDVYGSAKIITSTDEGGLITVNSKEGTVQMINANSSAMDKLHDVTITQIGKNKGITSIHGGTVAVNITNEGTSIGTVSAQNGLTIAAPNTAIGSAFLNLKPLAPTIVAKSIEDYYLGSDMVDTALNTTSTVHVTVANNVIKNIHMGGLGQKIAGTGSLKLTFTNGIRGNIYMGGDGGTAEVSVPLEFELQTDNVVGGSIYGGSVNTAKTGSSTITLTSGAVTGNVYGGPLGGGTTTKSEIKAASGSTTKITGTIYGGGYEGKVDDVSINLQKDVFVNNATEDLIFGGSQHSGAGGPVSITLGTPSTPISFARKGNIYGGGHGAGGTASVGDTKITFVGTGTTPAGTVPSPYELKGSLFGGSKVKGTSGNIIIELEGVGVSRDVQGGSAGANAIGSADVIIRPNGASYSYIGGNVYGGGAGTATGEIANLVPKRTTRVTLGASGTAIAAETVVGNVFGGGNGGAVSGNGSQVIINSGAKVIKDIFGGGNGASVSRTEAPATKVDYNGVVAGEKIYGGSLNGDISGGTQVNINTSIGEATNPRNVYGGNSITKDTHFVTGGTVVNVTAAIDILGNIYGGGAITGGASEIGGGTKVITNGAITGHIYGGEYLKNGLGLTSTIEDGTAVSVAGGTVTEAIYGGSYGDVGATTGAMAYSTITGGTVVTIDSPVAGPVYGGSHNVKTGPMTVDKTKVNINAKVTNSVFGGGHTITAGGGSAVTATAVVNIDGPVTKPIYGGGEANAGTVNAGATQVNVNYATVVNVYGGGLANGSGAVATVTTDTDVQIKAAVTPNVYGGGHSLTTGETSVNGTAKVTLTDDNTVTGFIYGGGHGGLSGASANAANTLVTLGSANSDPALTKVTQSVYGGGHGDETTSHVTGEASVVGKKATVNVNIYGGGRAVGADANVNTLAKVDLIGVVLADISGDDGFVYGGGHGAGEVSSTGETAVTIDAMIAPKSVYGGGHGDLSAAPVTNLGLAATATGKTSVTIGGSGATKVTDSVYGGGRAVDGHATVVQTGVAIKSDADITGTVYGGGHGNFVTGGLGAGLSANVLSILDGSNPPTDPSATNVTVAGKVATGVYGGGYATGTHTANVAGGTLVKVLAGAKIFKNVYGGGRDTAVGQTAKVDLTGGTTIDDTIYGGGHGEGRSAETTKTKITVNGGSEATAPAVAVGAKNVYGGGYAENYDAIVSVETVIDARTLETTESVYGGGHAVAGNATVGNGRLTPATTLIALGGATKVTDSVYGGGCNMNAATNADIKGYTDVTLKGSTAVENNVYGGGHAAVGVAHVSEFTIVTLDEGSNAENVFGGGHGLNAEAHIDNASGTTVGTNVTIKGNAQVTQSVYGGGYSPEAATGQAANIKQGGTSVTVTGAGAAKVGKNVYGGGHSDVADAKVVGNTTVTISKTISEVAVVGTVYGGGRGVTTNAEVAGNTTVTIRGQSVVGTDVYGGGHAKNGLAKIVSGPNGVGNTYVSLLNTALVNGNVYGGGRAENNEATIGNITVVTLNGTAYGDGGTVVDGNVYGGGHGLNSGADILGGQTTVLINNAKVGPLDGNVYGGGRVDTTAGSAKVPGDTMVTITQSQIMKDVYGGGTVEITPPVLTNSPLAEVARTTTVTLGVQNSGRYEIGGNVYGGGHNAHVNRETNVKVYQGNVSGDVFGGGHGFAQVNLPLPTTQAALKAAVTHVIIDNNGLNNPAGDSVKKSVYGGGRSQDADINGSTSVVVQPLGKIDLDLYGGGRGSDNGFDKSLDVEPDTSIGYDATKSNIIHGGTNVNIKGWIGQDAYAGGQHQSHVMGDDGTYIMLDQFGYVHRDLHGGGRNSTVLKDTETIVASGGTGNRDVYGGSANHKDPAPGGIQDHHIGEETLVTIRTGGAVKRDVYGAGDFSETRGALGTTVDISGHVYRDVYGGGNREALVLGIKGTKVDIYPTGLVGQPLSNPDPKHESNFPTFDFDDDLETIYNWPSAGHVYGGGSFNSHVAMRTSTAGQGEGTNVTVHAKGTVRGVVFGGGKGSNVVAHDPTQGNANVLILGYVGRVHGGGRVEEYKGTQLEAKTFDTTNGTVLHVTGPEAIVFTDAYGGGFGGFKGNSNLVDGALNLKADVLIDNGANVRFRVFGGGNQFGATTQETTNVVFTGETTIIGHAQELFGQTRTNEFITGWINNTLYKADDRAKYGTDYFDRWMYYRDREFTSLGSIYGGGNGTSVGVSTNIDIGDNTQIALNFVSGGNIGVKSLDAGGAEIPRTIQIGHMGAGDLIENSYTDTNKYGLIRVLGDYTKANSNTSYLTIYYHLDGVDGGNTTDKTLIMDDAYQTSGTNYLAELVVDTGIYHPWRPEPHTVVRVEPTIQMVNGSKFRMQYGYTIKLQNGIFPETTLSKDMIALLMDLPINPASTSKIYAPKDNVLQSGPFHYRELPFTIELSRLQDIGNEDERGLRMYFPSNNVDDTDGKNTNTGGTDRPDKGTGNSGGWGGAWSGGITDSSTPVVGGQVVGATGTIGYLLNENKVAEQDEVLKNLQTALASSKTSTVIVSERLAGQVSSTTLSAMAKNAAKDGKTAIYQADTVRGNRIEGRMSIDTSKAAGVTGTLKTGVYTAVQMTKQVGTMFAKYFQNRLSVVRLAQEGPLGAEVKIAAYVNLRGMDLNSLHFYAYSAQNNNYQPMPSPRYSVDKNGYLHFYTNVGGHIVITDKPLVRK